MLFNEKIGLQVKIWKVVPEYWGNAPHPTLTGIGVTWLYGFKFEIKVIAKIPG